ncbi:MAG: glutamate--tRNA ligase [Pseudomonadota bacterium]
MTNPVRTRFAPSPTGFLHIGGARTALFNWLFARHYGGEFLLRIEDTDRKRSTQEAIDAILAGLAWLELSPDEPPVYQSAQASRHVEVAKALLEAGHAYYCYASPEELAELRENQKSAGLPLGYEGRWRERDTSEAPAGVDPVVRFKSPLSGTIEIDDLVQGRVSVACDTLDDLVLLRADGTPTYNLSVVVDDHDMGITHILRGDDHLTNSFRQRQIADALGWSFPVCGHVPLIHGSDGAKLSKRHGALGVEAYRDMGYLPAALRNYLLRLGWAHGDEEIVSTQRAISLFDGTGMGKGPSRLDSDKLGSVNAAYMRATDDADLASAAQPFLESLNQGPLTPAQLATWNAAMPSLKERADTLKSLAEAGYFYISPRPIALEEKAKNILAKTAPDLLKSIHEVLLQIEDWSVGPLEAAVKDFVNAQNLGFGKVAQPLRASLCGKMASPGLFDVLYVLGKDESLARIGEHIKDDMKP